LLRWAEGLELNENIPNPEGEMGMITVNGYGKNQKVWIMPTFTDDKIGIPYCTNDYLDMIFLQEGRVTPLSQLMIQKNHIFMIFPKSIYTNLDWRLPVFECGNHLIGFDGTALMMYEIFSMHKNT
jgi:hypothetical protein